MPASPNHRGVTTKFVSTCQEVSGTSAVEVRLGMFLCRTCRDYAREHGRMRRPTQANLSKKFDWVRKLHRQGLSWRAIAQRIQWRHPSSVYAMYHRCCVEKNLRP